MDAQTVTLIALAILVLAGLCGFLAYRKSIKWGVKTGLGEMTLEGANEAKDSKTVAGVEPAVRVEDAVSREGGMRATDTTSRGAHLQRIEVKKDIDVSSGPPEGNAGPKKA
jgi:hypothetical protein